MSVVQIEIIPRKPFKPFLQSDNRFSCIVAHRRAGKTVACIQKLIKAAIETDKPNARFAYIAPFYAQAKDVAWQYVKQYTGSIPGTVANEGELHVTFAHNGARIRLYGADNYDRMRGIYLDGCILDENGDMDPRAWAEVIRPALSDRKGWATFIGTPKGRNAFYDVHRLAEESADWLSVTLRASESGLIDADELADARRTMTPEQYEQEYECSFDAAIIGAYYGQHVAEAERDGRVGFVDADLALPVHTAWDLGIGDSTAIWLWQAAPDGLRVIDHIEDHGKALPHYVAELEAKGYRYGADFVPHDAMARELGTGRTRVETLQSLGRKPQLVARHTVEDGINATRQLFGKMWFDAERCAKGIEALRQYRTEFDDKTKAFKNRPRHDWTSHTADAARYMALAYREMAKPKPAPKAEPFKSGIRIGPPEPRKSTRIRL